MAIISKAKSKAKKPKPPPRDYCAERRPQKLAMLIVLWLGICGALGDNIVYGFYKQYSSEGKTIFLSLVSMAGSIAFALLCYWVVEKYHYIVQYTTDRKNNPDKAQIKKNLRNTFLKLLGLALICEIPFDCMKNGTPIAFSTQNLMFTVAFGFLALCAINKEYDLSKIVKGKKKQKKYSNYIRFSLFTALMLISAYSNFDYGGEGVVLMASLDYARKRKVMPLFQFFAFLLFILIRKNFYYIITLISLIIIYIIEAKKNYKAVKESSFRNLENTAFIVYLIQVAALMIIKLFKTAG